MSSDGVRRLAVGVAAAVLLSTAASGVQAANIVQDPGFEASDNTLFWTFSSDWETGPIATPVHSGLHDATNGCSGAACVDPTSPNASFLSQTLTTVAGHHYDLSFWFAGDGTPDELKVLWGGNQVLDLQDAQIVSNSGGPETLYTVSNLIAAGSATVLRFYGRQDPRWDGLDDVSVTPAVSSVPEPRSWAMLMIGAFGAGALLRGRRRRAAAV